MGEHEVTATKFSTTPEHARPGGAFTGRRVHLVGAGGSGMSGLAMMLHAQGVSVTGSDMAASPTLTPLAEAGIPIALGPSAGGLPEDRDLLVHSAAIPPDHPELLEAQHRGMEILSYAEALGQHVHTDPPVKTKSFLEPISRGWIDLDLARDLSLLAHCS